MATSNPTPTLKRMTVKQVLSGDQIVLQDPPKGGPPNEEQLIFSNIIAPKLGRVARGDFPETKDEPYAWEAREFLRKKLVGEEVTFQVDVAAARKYGVVFLGNENITESLLLEGFAKVRETRSPDERVKKLIEAQDKAKAAKKGIWDEENAQQHVRNVKGLPENLSTFVEDQKKKPVKAIIEHVRDGSNVRAYFVDHSFTASVALTGIRCPAENDEKEPSLGKEAKFFVEKRLLQRDLEIVLDSTMGNGFYGTLLHPKGNIAEILLKEGFAHCVDRSLYLLEPSASERLRAAEKIAKENRQRRWRDYQPQQVQVSEKEKGFAGTVVEVINGDGLMIKVGTSEPRKIFLSSIRPPRDTNKTGEEAKTEAPATKSRVQRPLYDIPWLFEAREYLRKKLIGKRVNVTVDYTQEASPNFPEKVCCTVKIGGANVAETLVMKGLATVVRHGQNDENRSSCYDALKAAEEKAKKSLKGLHGKKDTPPLRITDVSTDAARAKTFLSSLQRSGRVEAVVEFVSSGSRLRIYIPKETCLATFLLAGINCPRVGRTGGAAPVTAEAYGDEALAFTREHVMQREVEIQVDAIDKFGSFIGWVWVDGTTNLSVALVQEGLAFVHFSAEKTQYYQALKNAEEQAKTQRIKLWKNYVEAEAPEEKPDEDTVQERKVDYQSVVITEVTRDLKFYAQMVDQGPKLEALMTQIREEFHANPPLPGAYTPRKGDLCAAKYVDDEWYRARVERVQGGQVTVFYIDYGNRDVTSSVRCSSLPGAFTTDKPYANEFALAFVKLPTDPEYQEDASKAFRDDVQDRTLSLNVEYRIEKTVYATLTCPESKEDIGKNLVADGYLMVDPRRDKRLQKVMSEYKAAQDDAKKQHKVIWQYGDITEDDAKEFGR